MPYRSWKTLKHFLFQVYMASLQRPSKLNIPTLSWMQHGTDYDDMICEKGVPTMITWSYGGREVAVEGSWDDWKTKYLGAVTISFSHHLWKEEKYNTEYLVDPFFVAVHIVHVIPAF